MLATNAYSTHVPFVVAPGDMPTPYSVCTDEGYPKSFSVSQSGLKVVSVHAQGVTLAYFSSKKPTSKRDSWVVFQQRLLG